MSDAPEHTPTQEELDSDPDTDDDTLNHRYDHEGNVDAVEP